MATVTNATSKAPAITAEIEGRALYLTFSNGQKLTLNADDLSTTITHAALMHGLKQKLVDAAAMSRNTTTGASATIDDKFAAVAEVHARLLAGEWNKGRDGSGGSGSLLLRALVRLYAGSKDRATLAAWIEGKTKAEQAALRATPKIAAIIEEIKAESAGASVAGIDGDALLGELA